MYLRLVLNILLFLTILFLPWWFVLLAALALLIVFDAYEILFWGLFIDALYGNPSTFILFSFEYVFTIGFLAVLIISFIIKRKVIFYDRIRV